MPQDAFHIRRISGELSSLLVGGKINRISQVNKDELTFIIYTGKATVKLIISTNASNARVCLSAVEKEPAPVAPNFCMLLRKTNYPLSTGQVCVHGWKITFPCALKGWKMKTLHSFYSTTFSGLHYPPQERL